MFSSRKSSAPASGGLTKSLRFRNSASAYLSRTQSSTTNNLKWTLSLWLKKGNGISGNNFIISASPDNYVSNQFSLDINSNNTLRIIQLASGTLNLLASTSAIFVDSAAWYHIVLVYDSANSTANNRTLLYVNNVLQTLSYSYGPVPQNTTCFLNSNTVPARIASSNTTPIYFDGYIADTYLIDGQALTPSSFGATNATTGQWSPATYSGTYGTNGFHLTFGNTTSTTALGYDTSGNSNNWTTNNISLTAGSTYDSMNDYPVAYSATAANYAVWNPLKTYNATFTNGNLDASVAATSGSGTDVGLGGFGMSSGKWYWEVTCNSITAAMIGISDASASASSSSVFTANGWAYYSGGQKYNNNSGPSYAASFTSGDIIGVALDMDAGTLAFYKNGASQGVAYSTGLTGKTMIAMVGTGSGSVTQTYSANFGQRAFAYTAPSGYNALNTYNLPTPTIAQGNKYFNSVLYTGNGSTNTITGVGFQPDFVWAKDRGTANAHRLVDAVRGVTKTLYSNLTDAEGTESGLTAFNSDGFTLGSATGMNYNTEPFVAWNWKANGSGSSNTNGSITSTVSASTTSGFSVVTYTGTGSDATVGHGLGVVPSMIIGKNRNNTNDWRVYHTSIGAANILVISTTAASASGGTWNSTTPTSTVFTVAGGANMNVNSSTTYVAYCFAPIAGFSAFGSYTGNGSTSGPFIYCGFKPRWIMIKITSGTDDWYIWDTARNTYNGLTLALYADLSNAEYTYPAQINVLSNGFNLVGTGNGGNASGATYIYMAFASNPFAYSNAF